ncbi:MAG: UDP-4-amino-4,6-dideoxy-N-acetyl-beta-L-altrosamine N-acetyltransferase [Cyclobacteriaceae bacterium]
MNIQGQIEIEGIQLINFNCLSIDEIDMVLSWRNNIEIRQWMINSDEIPIQEHISFIESLKTSENKVYFLAKRNEKNLGVIYFNDYNNETKQAEFGLYLNPSYLGSGLGFELFFCIIQIAFIKLKLDKIYSQSKVENTNTLMLHEFFGIKEQRIISQRVGGVDMNLSYRLITKSEFEKMPSNLKEVKKHLRQFLLQNLSQME